MFCFLTFFSWFSSLTHSSLLCSRPISRLFSLLSFFRAEEAREEAFSFRSNNDVWRERRNTKSDKEEK